MTFVARAHTLLLMLLVAIGLTLIAMLATRASGGPLDPPGAPGPTDGVRAPGTAIDALPYTINQPGNYFVTRNLTATNAGGITINASNVTLDLGGFVLDGANQSLYGVYVNPGFDSIIVRNGSAIRWVSHAFFLVNTTAKDLSANNNGIGVYIQAGSLTGCSARSNTTVGVDAAQTAVTGCSAKANAIGIRTVHGSVTNCSTISNTDAGIVSDRSVVAECTSWADRYGIVATSSSNIHHNVIDQAQSDGIRLVAVSGPGGRTMVTDNTVGIAGVSFVASGIYVETNDNRISRNNVTRSNLQAPGIYVVGSFNVIDENSVLENLGGQGIVVAGSKNTVVRNMALGNDFPVVNYQIGAGNNAGPVDAAAASTNPWSNTQ